MSRLSTGKNKSKQFQSILRRIHKKEFNARDSLRIQPPLIAHRRLGRSERPKRR